jgi:hypothetical protein
MLCVCVQSDLDLADKNFDEPKHCFHLYQAGKDSDMLISRATKPFERGKGLAADMKEVITRLQRGDANDRKRLVGQLYQETLDVDKPQWNGRPIKAPRRWHTASTVRAVVSSTCDIAAPICRVCNHQHFQGQPCPICGHVQH